MKKYHLYFRKFTMIKIQSQVILSSMVALTMFFQLFMISSGFADEKHLGAWEQKSSCNDSAMTGYISPRTSAGKYADDDLSGYSSLGIAFGYDIDPKQSLEVDFAIADTETDGNGKVTEMFEDNPGILAAAINYRYFFTSRHEFPGVYMLAGLAYNSLYWDYKEGIHDRNGKVMNSDEVDGTEITFGLGMTVMSFKKIDLRFEILPAIVIWDDRTDNDIDHGFNPGRLVKFRLLCDFYVTD